ncbi:MAG: NADH:flavin oxidoreductase [Atribacterota bacterium]|nr:NADH:flavin oxidoreductase [Atribacterota bacterium]
MKKDIFGKNILKGIEIKNRFVRSATYEGLADDKGFCTNKITQKMVELAKGEVGLIITSHAYVSENGQAGPKQLGIYDDSMIDSYKEMINSVHQENSKIVMQISHAGGRSLSKEENKLPAGPSTLNIEGYTCREITKDEINKIIKDFADAAGRAIKAGFDGVQIHAAHGYLLSQFLSPFFNKRSDSYGGSVKNRARIILEIINAIKSKLPDNTLLIIKMNANDYISGGLTTENMLETALLFEENGVDAIELSGGTALNISKYSFSRKITDSADSKKEDVYYRDEVKLLKNKLKIPVILVGGIKYLKTAEDLIIKEGVDYISLCRPLIKEPDLIKRWKIGDTEESSCIHCNQCFLTARTEIGLHCPLNK